MKALRGLLLTLRPADLFSLPVLVGTVLEFGLVQLVSPYNTRGHLPLTALLQFLTVGVAFAFLGVVYLLLRRRVREPALRVVLLACIPIGALLGGLFLDWSRLSVGLDASSLLGIRVTSTCLHVTAVTVLLWLAVSGTRLHYERLDALTRERHRLEALDLQARQSLAELDVEATEAVRSRILDGLKPADVRDPQSIVMTLTSTLEDIVRPLSRQLESQSEKWTPPAPPQTPQERIDWTALSGWTAGCARRARWARASSGCA